MLKREDAYAKAFEIKAETLAKKKAEYNKKINDLHSDNERFSQISRELSELGAKIALTAISGDKAALNELQERIKKASDEKAEIIKNSGINDIEYDCEKCRDSGYIDGKICGCIKATVKNLIISDLAKELPLDECGFDKFSLSYYPNTEENGISPKRRMEQLYKLCTEYAESFNPKSSANLLFMGSAGLGKTHLSLSVAKELLQKGYDVIYGSAYNLFSQMENEHFSDRSNESYNAAVSCDLLIIDDLGSEFVSPYILSMIYNVINTRLLASLPTVISTNLTMSEIEKKYTPRISSRLVGNFTAKKFLGNDIRQLKIIEQRKG